MEIKFETWAEDVIELFCNKLAELTENGIIRCPFDENCLDVPEYRVADDCSQCWRKVLTDV